MHLAGEKPEGDIMNWLNQNWLDENWLDDSQMFGVWEKPDDVMTDDVMTMENMTLDNPCFKEEEALPF